MTNDGILAIWHDVDEAIGDEYERWYFREHLPERVGVPGFVAGRRYEAVSRGPRFLTCYEAESPDIFVSKPYIDRLNDPTPWTMEVLRHFRDTNRTICRRTWEAGRIRGAWGGGDTSRSERRRGVGGRGSSRRPAGAGPRVGRRLAGPAGGALAARSASASGADGGSEAPGGPGPVHRGGGLRPFRPRGRCSRGRERPRGGR